jgi:hypothetical protein
VARALHQAPCQEAKLFGSALVSLTTSHTEPHPCARSDNSLLSNVLGNPFLFSRRLIRHNVIDVGIFLLGALHPPTGELTAALARIAGNGVRTIIVETANRFARDLMVQEVGFAMLRDTLIAADSPSSFLDDGPTSKLIRQILGAVSEFDKAMTVAKLKGARDRVRRQRGKCEGRKSYAEREGGAELVALARELHTNPNGRSPSLRTIAAALAAQGFVTPSGRHYSPSAVASMLTGQLRGAPRCGSFPPSSDCWPNASLSACWLRALERVCRNSWT